MEVTRKNFEKVFPEILERIKTATFIALDGEYTGLHADSIDNSNTLFDSASQRYSKLKKNITRFTICQLGIAIFEKEIDQNKYKVNSYNIYVHGVAFDVFAKRDILQSQLSCLNFLAHNNFDFNKFIKEGVPFLGKEKMESLRKFLKSNPYFMSTCEFLDPYYFPNVKEHLTESDVEDIVDRLRGVSKIIDALQSCGKPIVGHNMLMDLILIYHHFVQEIPNSYKKFKTEILDVFPTLFDTKVIATHVQDVRRDLYPGDRVINDTNLFALYTSTASLHECNTPQIVVKNESTKYSELLQKGWTANMSTICNSNCHEAAFDAIVTGAVFLRLAYLTCFPEPTPLYNMGYPPTVTELIFKIDQWKNHINIGRAQIRYINLNGRDPESHRPDLMKIKATPASPIMNAMMLRRQLAKFGDLEIEIQNRFEAIIACGGVITARKVWRCLEEQGFAVEKVQESFLSSNVINKVIRLTAAILAVAGLTYLSIRRLTSLISR